MKQRPKSVPEVSPTVVASQGVGASAARVEPDRPEPKPYRQWHALFLFLFVPCLAYTIYSTLRAIPVQYTPIPAWDYWREVEGFQDLIHFVPRHFLMQHNEHRIIFPEVIFALDFICGAGRGMIPVVANFTLQIAHLFLMLWLLKREKAMTIAYRVGLGCVVALNMATMLQVRSLDTPFLLQWYLCQCAVTTALFLLWRSSELPAARFFFWGALAAAVVATYSSANGMLIWPVIVLLAVLCGFRHLRVAAAAVTGAVSIALYLINLELPRRGGLGRLLSHPLQGLWFVGVYLGGPASYFNLRIGGIVGLLSLVVVIYAFQVLRQRREIQGAFGIIVLGNCLFAAATAVMTAVGRLDLGDPSARDAATERYAPSVLVFWAFLTLLAGWLAFRRGQKREAWLCATIGMLTLCPMMAIMDTQRPMEEAGAAGQSRFHDAGIAVLAGVEDPEVFGILHWNIDMVGRSIPTLRNYRLSVFASNRDRVLQKPLSEMFTVAPADFCSGAIFKIDQLSRGGRVTGWALDRRTNRPPERIILATSSGVIVGLGETRRGGFPLNPSLPTAGPVDWQWVGYLRSESPLNAVQAFALVEKDQMACPLGPPHEMIGAASVGPDHVGPVITMQGWKSDSNWALNGFHTSVGSPIDGRAFGSWTGDDRQKGKFRFMPFPANGKNCIVVPIARGPSALGQSAEVRDAETDQVIAKIPVAQQKEKWTYWLVPLKQSNVNQLEITAADEGDGWGQWIGVAEPHTCK
jgi:hypothetical protein